MLAVDTNILVRYLTQDDAEQSDRANRVVEESPIWVPTTVLLETEWVLRTAYKRSPTAIVRAFRSSLGLANVETQAADIVSVALGWLEQGMGFADALHLATAKDCDGLVTFDRDLIRLAARLGAGRVVEP